MTDPTYPRDLVGYGAEPPHARWPGQARIALQFVVNYEEGAEYSVLHGDDRAEWILSDMAGAAPVVGERHISMESLYDYGARAGFWRIMRLFEERSLPLTVFAVAMALERNAAVSKALAESAHEVACHGYKHESLGRPSYFIPGDREVLPEEVGIRVRRSTDVLTGITGVRPVSFRAPRGWGGE